MPKTAMEESIEETKKLLEEATAREQKELEDAIKSEEPIEKVDEAVSEVKPEEKTAEEPEPKVEAKEEPVKNPAQIRLAKKAEKQRLEEELAVKNADNARLSARVAELERPAAKIEEEIVPDKAEDPAGFAEFVARKAEKTASVALEKLEKIEQSQNQQESVRRNQELETAAKSELFQMESALKQTTPDYDDVKAFYVKKLAFSFKSLNKNMTDQQLVQAIDKKIFNEALALHAEGYENPVAALYEQIKSDGYTPTKNETKEEKLKPNLDQVAKNKARNAGTVGAAAGTGSGEVTPRYAATEMTVEEVGKLFSTMNAAEKKNFYRQLGG